MAKRRSGSHYRRLRAAKLSREADRIRVKRGRTETARPPARLYFLRGFQMRQRLFGVLGSDVGVLQLAVLDGGLQMRNPFRRMGIWLLLLGRLGMRQRRFGMGYEQIGMAFFSMHNGFLGVTDRFGQMILGQRRGLARERQRLQDQEPTKMSCDP